jgi:hypothetical protein
MAGKKAGKKRVRSKESHFSSGSSSGSLDTRDPGNGWESGRVRSTWLLDGACSSDISSGNGGIEVDLQAVDSSRGSSDYMAIARRQAHGGPGGDLRTSEREDRFGTEV